MRNDNEAVVSFRVGQQLLEHSKLRGDRFARFR